MHTIYTIGYSGLKTSDFMNTINNNNISAVIDVRSSPYSRLFSDYNIDNIKNLLKGNGIYYRNYNKEFGARQLDKKYYSDKGYLEFEKFVKSLEFQQGVEKLRNGMESGYIFTLMCAEKDPIDCHRSIMVAKEFHRLGYIVHHLLSNNKVQSQEDLENRLLEKYYPNKNQISLTDENYADEELVYKAYQKRNSEIGYSLEGE